MTVHEDIIEIIIESGSTGFKKALQILYYLMIKKASGERTVTKDIRERLFIPKKSVYNNLAELEAQGLIEYEYGRNNAREKEVKITQKGENYLYRKILPLFAPHQTLIREIVCNNIISDEIEQMRVLEDFLDYLQPKAINLFYRWIQDQMGSIASPVVLQGFEHHFREFINAHVCRYINSALNRLPERNANYQKQNHRGEVRVDK